MYGNYSSLTWNRDALSVDRLNLNIGSKSLLINSDVKISFGDKIVLLGINGSGKTSLFKFISNISNTNKSNTFNFSDIENKHSTSTPLTTLMTQNNKNVWTIFEVQQELPPSSLSITSVVLSSHIERGLLWNRRSELELKEELSSIELDEYNNICEKLYSADSDPAKAKKILKGLGFQDSDFNKSLNTFSGGWKARVSLACGLFMEPDLLLLDEPTNHLDLNAVLWLTEFCKLWKKTLIIITHNGYFAENISDKIFHIYNQKLTIYKCSFYKFLQMRDKIDEKALNDWTKVEKEYLKIKSKGTPKDKKIAEEFLKKKELEGIIRPPKIYSPKFIFKNEIKNNHITSLLSLTNVSFYHGDLKILKNINLALYPQSRVVIVGQNGAGKSTLLKLLNSDYIPSKGTISRKNNIIIKYFNQHFYNDLPHDLTPLEYLSSQSLTKNIDNIRKILGMSGLSGEAHTRKIDTLSGGQKSRVYIAGLIISEPDILLLDEPTNHLDMETTSGLLNSLKEFQGAIIIVSHDIDFIREIGTEVWVIKDKKVSKIGEGIDGLDVYISDVLDTIDI
jgi:ATP-binding cassette subfamily F protein 3